MQPARSISTEALLAVVAGLYSDLHHPQSEAVSLDSRLEADLGLDSLGRVELTQRLEQAFQVHLTDGAVGSAATVAELLKLIVPTSGRPDSMRICRDESGSSKYQSSSKQLASSAR